jgi:hypothetical protein
MKLFRALPFMLMSLLVFVALGWFVWPSRYRYDRLKDMPVRIDRLTGRAEGLSRSGWFPLEADKRYDPKVYSELPTSELAKLDGRCSIDSMNWINCDIYNGSDWTLGDVTVAIDFPDPYIDLSAGFIDQPQKPSPQSKPGPYRGVIRDEPTPGSGKTPPPKRDNPRLSRNYKLFMEPYESGAPLESARFHAALGDLQLKSGEWSWKFVAVRGKK